MTNRNEVKRLQNLVNELFVSTLTTKEDEFRLSYPLIPRISKEYLKNRVVVVGQETNTWYDAGSDIGDYNHIFLNSKNEIENEALSERYDIFVKEHVQNYGGKFWDFNRLLYKKEIIKGDIVKNGELSYCWINIFAMEACCDKKDENGRPTKNQELRKAILKHQGMLTYHLLKILSPKLIIFLTGHSLDNVICEYALNLHSKDSFEGIDKNHILQTKHACKIITDKDSCFSNATILRLYHPAYFMGRINTYKLLKDKVTKEIGEEIIPYYQPVAISFLKKWKAKHEKSEPNQLTRPASTLAPSGAEQRLTSRQL